MPDIIKEKKYHEEYTPEEIYMPEECKKDFYIDPGETVPVKIIKDYRRNGKSGVIDLGTYTKYDRSEEALKFANEILTGQPPYLMRSATSLCSTLVKPVEKADGRHIIMGRNMDLPNSFYPLCVFRTAVPGKYRTANIAYVSIHMETFDQIAETGTMSKDMYDIMPFVFTDSVNEKGLFIEANMRPIDASVVTYGGFDPTKPDINEFPLMRGIIDNCATIEEAIEYCKQFNVCALYGSVMQLHIAYCLMDSTGRYGVIEFANGKTEFTEFPGQTNYWISKEFKDISPMHYGYGRWDAIMRQYHKIEGMKDMGEVMDSIRFSHLFRDDISEIRWDPRTDLIGYLQPSLIDTVESYNEFAKNLGLELDEKHYARMIELGKLTEGVNFDTAYCTDPRNAEIIFDFYQYLRNLFVRFPNYAKKLSCLDECSDIQTVNDNREYVLHAHFFEQDDWFRLDPFGDGDAMEPEEAPEN